MNRKDKRYKAPGKAYREGISLIELFDMFPNDITAEKWFESVRWPTPESRHCPKCGSTNTMEKPNRKPLPFRCRDCKKFFSVRHGSVMERSHIPLRKWAIAIYLNATSLKGVSSMKLHRDLGITQKSAWYMAHRIKEALTTNSGIFAGPVEVDETFMGGKERNKHEDKRSHIQGPKGKVVVIGMKDRGTNKITATTIPNRSKEEIHGFIDGKVDSEAKVYTDDHKSYKGIPYDHESVNHSVGEYVRDQAHTNGLESFWAMLKRGYDGTYHNISEKHLDRYVNEFAGRHNIREKDTIEQMKEVVRGMIGKKLEYKDLVND